MKSNISSLSESHPMIACVEVPQAGIVCERRRIPDLDGRPVALENCGIIVAASDEAAQCGVKTGIASTFARSLCRDLVVLPYDRSAYMQAAEAVWNALAMETSLVEPASPEVVYAELSGFDIGERAWFLMENIFPQVCWGLSPLEEKQREYDDTLDLPTLPARSFGETGRPIAGKTGLKIGVASSKIAAREAARRSDGCPVIVPAGHERDAVASVAVSSIERFSATVRARAAKLGLVTLADVAKTPVRELERQFKGDAVILRRLAEGIDGEPVRPEWPPRSIRTALAFDDALEDTRMIENALAELSQRIAAKLSKERRYSRGVSLKIFFEYQENREGIAILKNETYINDKNYDSMRTSPPAHAEPFSPTEGDEKSCGEHPLSLSLWERKGPAERDREVSEELSAPAQSASEIEKAAVRLWRRMAISTPITRMELSATGLTIGSGVQLALFGDDGDTLTFEQRQSLDASVAHIKEKFGIASIIPGELLRKAQRISLWTYPLGRLAREHVNVATAENGRPLRIIRAHGRTTLHVTAIQNSWRETDWTWGRLAEKSCYRVLTAPDGLYELWETGGKWEIRGAGD